jgi:Zn-finger protein
MDTPIGVVDDGDENGSATGMIGRAYTPRHNDKNNSDFCCCGLYQTKNVNKNNFDSISKNNVYSIS